MNSAQLKQLIREVPDFPRKGILFYDITTLLKNKVGFATLVDRLSEHYVDQKIDLVLALTVPTDLLIERAVLRRTDKRTGQIYHLKYSPPPPGAELEHRADDHEEVVRKRLDTYEAMTAELLPFYAELGILKRVDGVGSMTEVTARVIEALASK